MMELLSSQARSPSCRIPTLSMHVRRRSAWELSCRSHPLLKTTLTGLRRTYLRFLFFRPKLTKTKRFPPFLDHMNGKLFLGGSRFWSGKIGPKLAVGGHRSQCPAELSFIFNRCPARNPLFLTDKIYFRQRAFRAARSGTYIYR